MPASGFRLGDHTFLAPGEDAPLSRLRKSKGRGPIAGAAAPGWLGGCIAAGVDADGPAQGLLDGEFCGHREPTFTVFDLELDGTREIELAVEQDEDEEAADKEEGGRVLRVLGRGAGSGAAWTVLFDRAWIDWEREDGPAGCPGERVLVPAAEVKSAVDGERQRVAVGLEYPCDAGSAAEVSWMTVLFTPVGEDEVFVVLDEEMA